MKRALLIATRNRHKLEELQEILADLNIELLSLNDVASIPEIIEDGKTFEDNAIKKAHETANLTGYLTLADDSGLMVDALQGAPGVYSARYSGPGATDEKNNQKLLAELKNISPDQRTAQFVCVIAVADPDGNVRTVEGVCKGSIAQEPAGSEGFGYDPLFIPEGFSRHFAQLSPDEKNAISHRGRALQKVKPLLTDLMGE